jgi:glucokinase
MVLYGGIDLGATGLRAVIGDSTGAVEGLYRAQTPQGPSGRAVTDAVLDCLRAACRDAGCRPVTLAGVGIGSIGPLDRSGGAVLDTPNLPGVDRVELTSPVAREADTDHVVLHNDAVAGLLGERFYREASPENAVYLTISTGIGAGVAVDGTVLDGYAGNAAEAGHFVVDTGGTMTCGCGIDGHWEGYCSGSNLPRYATRLYERESVETILPVGEDDFEARDVFEYAKRDPLADRVLEDFCEFNALGVANVVHAYAPENVYIGGAVALNNPEYVYEPIRARLPDYVLTSVPEVERPTLGTDAVLKGALASAVTNSSDATD